MFATTYDREAMLKSLNAAIEKLPLSEPEAQDHRDNLTRLFWALSLQPIILVGGGLGIVCK